MKPALPANLVRLLLAHDKAPAELYKHSNEARKLLKNIEFAENLENCIQDCDALVILTEWNEFRSLTPDKLINYMKGNILIDLRNALNPDSFAKSKFNLIQIGRKKTNQ